MIGLLVTAPKSGSGKTILTMALLALLQRRGLRPCAFKSGPDYIDSGFHRAVPGVKCRNLDLYLSDSAGVRQLYARSAAGYSAVVAEGAMGYYDGVGGTPRASAWELGRTLGLPALLVVDPMCMEELPALLAAHAPHNIAAVLLNRCPDEQAPEIMRRIRAAVGVPAAGWLPPTELAALPSRHLGLKMAAELDGMAERAAQLAEMLEARLDWQVFAQCFTVPQPTEAAPRCSAEKPVPLAVARDEAFCFCYGETLEQFEASGLEPVFFSPLHDRGLPRGTAGLYLPGGYPELYASQLSSVGSMRLAVRQAVQAGLPTVAECGGFLYLGQSLEDLSGRAYPMAGVLPGRGIKTERLVRFGYASVRPAADSMLFRAGEEIPVHEFHHWDSTANGNALHAVKPVSGKSWDCGFVSASLYAGFPHLYFAGRPQLADRLAAAARSYQSRKETE